MREFYLIAYVIIPIFLMMVLGYYITRKGIITKKAADQLNSMVFKYMLPVSLFMNIYNSDLKSTLNWKLIIYTSIFVFVIYALANILLPRFFTDRRKYVPMIHATYRSNYVIFGLVVVGGFYPDQVAVPSVIAAFVVPIFNVLGVILLEKGGTAHTDLKKTLVGIAKNPLISASVLGIAANLIGITVPAIPLKFLKDVASVANPLALLAIGMRFELETVKDNLKPMCVVLSLRLIILPVICVLGGILLGFRDVELMTLLIVSGSPAAVATYTLSQPYDLDHSLANLLVVATTLACLITMFVLLMFFSHTPYMAF